MRRGDGGSYGLAVTLLILMTLQAVALHSYATLAPFIRDGLRLDASAMGLLASAPYLGTLIAAFGLGGWVDRGIPHRVATITGGSVAVALGIVAVSDRLVLVAAGFLLIGIGRGAIPPLTDRLGYERAPLRTRGLVFGIKQTGSPVGSILAALALPPVAATALGWRGAVSVTAVTIGIVAVVTAQALARPGPEGAARVPATTSAGEHRADVVARLLRVLVTPTIYSFGVGLFMSSSLMFLTLFLVDVVELDAVGAARWFAVFGIGGVAGRIVWGWLSDRLFGGRRSYTLALTAVLGGGAAIAIGLVPGILAGVVGAALIGIYGFLAQGWVGIVRALGAELAGPGYSGRAGGLLLGSMMLGGLVGAPIFGWLVERSGDYILSWIFIGVLAILSGLLMLPTARREPARHHLDDGPGDPIHGEEQDR